MKRIKILIGVIILIGLLWYFFKGYNYRVTFKIQQSPSVVYNNILIWNDNKPSKDSAVVTLEKVMSKQIIQKYKLGDTLLKVNWNLKRLNDSTTKVIANITDLNAPTIRNIDAINSSSTFSKNSKYTIERFAKTLANYNKTFKIGNIKEDTIPGKYCAYISLKATADTKAAIMVQNIYKVMNYIKGNNIELNGDPFLQVTNWNTETDSINFDFCFPIKKQDSLPPTNTVFFKDIETKKALKTMFNGNYRNSHQAWRSLKDYSVFYNIKVKNTPIEFFLNDPHTGTNSLEWEAEVYLPLAQ